LKRLVLSLLLVASSVVGAGALTAAAGGPLAVPAHAATGLSIFVGYADNLRAAPTNFPTPWQGAPNTNFIGSNSPWDAGAIRLVNNGSSPISVDDASVDLHHGAGGASGPVFDLWGSFTVPANGQTIITETLDANSGDNFDTSDFPFEPCGTTAPPSDPHIPTVTVTVGGTPTTFSDSGHILDTGGFDSACQGNESIQWTSIGNAPCAGSMLTLNPPSQTQPEFGNATVTATFTNSCNQPLSGTPVNFSVGPGPNAGQTGTGVTDSNGNAPFTYNDAGGQGTDQVQASVTNPAGIIPSNTVTVTWTDAAISASPATFGSIEGQSSSGVVATFTDPDKSATAGEYSATIDWGDSTPLDTTATITQNADGSFSVNGTHTYAEEGKYPIKVTITDTDNSSNLATVSSTGLVGDARLVAVCAAAPISPQTFSGPTARFKDANPAGTSADFAASINWGDSSPATTGTVSGGPGLAPYTVSGGHTYASTGTFTITTTVTDDGGQTATTSCSVLVFAAGAPGGGSFVIGDNESAVGTSVTFWGAQWWKDNTTSTGSKAASFKGFAESPATPACGVTWSADPGNSTPPPSGPLPAYMAVIVTSSYGKSGPSISGDTPHIVIVKTNPGYAPDPGHAGTGTVVGIVC
jgi:hypothetical protein